MWHIENRKTFYPFRILDRKHPRYCRTPIMPDQIDFVIFQSIDQANYILDQFIHPVSLYTLWLITQVIAALVRHNDTTSRLHQCRDLISEPIPEFRKSMQQDNWHPTFRSSLHDMQANTVCFDITMFKFHEKILPPSKTRQDFNR